MKGFIEGNKSGEKGEVVRGTHEKGEAEQHDNRPDNDVRDVAFKKAHN